MTSFALCVYVCMYVTRTDSSDGDGETTSIYSSSSLISTAQIANSTNGNITKSDKESIESWLIPLIAAFVIVIFLCILIIVAIIVCKRKKNKHSNSNINKLKKSVGSVSTTQASSKFNMQPNHMSMLKSRSVSREGGRLSTLHRGETRETYTLSSGGNINYNLDDQDYDVDLQSEGMDHKKYSEGMVAQPLNVGAANQTKQDKQSNVSNVSNINVSRQSRKSSYKSNKNNKSDENDGDDSDDSMDGEMGLYLDGASSDHVTKRANMMSTNQYTTDDATNNHQTTTTINTVTRR